MYTIYRLNADDLDTKFLKSIKTLFKDKEIEIIISEADETEYLLRSEANKKRLLEAVENVNNRQGLIQVQIDDVE